MANILVPALTCLVVEAELVLVGTRHVHHCHRRGAHRQGAPVPTLDWLHLDPRQLCYINYDMFYSLTNLISR